MPRFESVADRELLLMWRLAFIREIKNDDANDLFYGGGIEWSSTPAAFLTTLI